MTVTIESPRYAPFDGSSAQLGLKEYRWVIETAIHNHPRSLQTRIGPSEIGTACDHCLAAKIAGWAKTNEGTPWLPTVGTAVHAWLEETFIRHENNRGAQHNGGLRYLTEREVTVGDLNGEPITGHTDLFDTVTGTVIDHKIVGATTLAKARTKGPTPVYRVQAHLYGRGWVAAGFTVANVAICFLPRNDVSLNSAVLWTEPYDEQIALTALARADRIARTLAALTSLSIEARDEWITHQPRDPDCWDCARYSDVPEREARHGSLLDGLPTH